MNEQQHIKLRPTIAYAFLRSFGQVFLMVFIIVGVFSSVSGAFSIDLPYDHYFVQDAVLEIGAL